MEGMSEREYSAHCGLSRGAIQNARRASRLVVYSDGSINAAASDVRRAEFIEPLSSDIRVIFVVEQEIDEEGVSLFHLPTISLREYLEHEHGELQIGDILSGNIDISKLNLSRDLYIKRGGYPELLLE